MIPTIKAPNKGIYIFSEFEYEFYHIPEPIGPPPSL